MDFRQAWIGGRLFLYVAQLLILIACVAYIEFTYLHNILPDKLVKETFIQTTCSVMTKQLSTTGRIIHRYRASFLVNYSVNGLNYQRWVTGNGLDQAFHHNRSVQEDELAQFDVGSAYPCWYNPDIPQIAVLVQRHDWMSTFPLFVPSVIATIMVYYLSKATLEFFGVLSYKRRQKIEEKKRQQR